MSEDIEPCTAPDAASRINLMPASAMGRLAPELVTAILEFLDIYSLRKAAAVSRIFYLSAWSAGLYLRGNIVCNPLGNSESRAALLDEIVQHALLNNRRLSLSLTFTVLDVPPGTHVQRILSAVGSSLPVLIYLGVFLGPRLLPGFVAALSHPAPNLRQLVLRINEYAGAPQFTLPADLFSGAAPNLRDLELRGVYLGPGLFPAFSQLSSVHLCYENLFPMLHYAAQFPRLRFLSLSYFAQSSVSVPGRVDLTGLRLRKLTISDAEHWPLIPVVSRWISPSRVPSFEYNGSRLHGDDPLWQEDIDAASMRLVSTFIEDSGASIQIVPAHRIWQRRYNVGSWHAHTPCPIRELTRLQLGKWLTYLRANNDCLIVLLEANWPALGALRDLRIDFHLARPRAAMVWPPDWSHTLRRGPYAFGPDDVSAETFSGESYRYLPCPALATLALCHFPADSTMRVESREVAFLGRALGQRARPVQQRAALVLVGVEFKTPVADALLEQTFSSVGTDDSSGASSPWARDGGLWDEERAPSLISQ